MKKLNEFRWWVYIVYISTRWIFRVNLGSIVIYKDEEYVVSNGVRPGSWTIYRLRDRLRIESAPRAECTLKVSFKNYLTNFRSGYSFYMTSWYGIWCRNGIEDWVRNCRIW